MSSSDMLCGTCGFRAPPCEWKRHSCTEVLLNAVEIAQGRLRNHVETLEAGLRQKESVTVIGTLSDDDVTRLAELLAKKRGER